MSRKVDLENNTIRGNVEEVREEVEPNWDEIIKQFEKRAVIEYKQDLCNKLTGVGFIILAILAVTGWLKLLSMTGGF